MGFPLQVAGIIYLFQHVINRDMAWASEIINFLFLESDAILVGNKNDFIGVAHWINNILLLDFLCPTYLPMLI